MCVGGAVWLVWALCRLSAANFHLLEDLQFESHACSREAATDLGPCLLNEACLIPVERSNCTLPQRAHLRFGLAVLAFRKGPPALVLAVLAF